VALVAACISDVLDGYIARKYNASSYVGTLLDPITDKIFVLCALSVLYIEGKMSLFEGGLFLLRDLSLFLFSLVLLVRNKFQTYEIRAFLSGKAMTTLQFLALYLVVGSYPVPELIWVLMALLGISTLYELLVRDRLFVHNS